MAVVRLREAALLLQLVTAWQLAWPATVSSAAVFRDHPEEDSAVSAEQGKTAVLHCTVPPPPPPSPWPTTGPADRKHVEWVRAASKQTLTRGVAVLAPSERHRLSVVGNQQSDGEYWLSIAGVRPSDAGEYRCTYGAAHRIVTLEVILKAEPDTPVCRVSPSPSQQRPGGEAELYCELSGNAASSSEKLLWYRDGDPVSKPAPGRSALRWVVEPEDNGVTFACSTSESGGGEATGPGSCEVTVLRRPPTGRVHPARLRLRPGETATYTCMGSGLPAVTSYRWTVNSVPVTGAEEGGGPGKFELTDGNRTLRIAGVTRRENGARVVCEVGVASGLTGLARARLAVLAAGAVTSSPSTNGFIPGLLFPPFEAAPDAAAESGDERSVVTSDRKPQQTNDGKAGVVAGTVLATVGVLLALSAAAVLFIRVRTNREPAGSPDKNGHLKEAAELPTTEDADCPIYAKPDKTKKGRAPQPPRPGADDADAGTPSAAKGEDGAAAGWMSRRERHSYERVEIPGQSPGQTCTLPVRLQGQTPSSLVASLGNRHSDLGRVVGGRPPFPPGLPPPRRGPLAPLAPLAPLPAASVADRPGLLYAELNLPARATGDERPRPAGRVDYASVQVHQPPH